MSEIPDISEVLLRGGTEPNPEIRQQAEQQINSMLESNFPLALATLTNEISVEEKNIVSRRIAGAVMRNSLSAKTQSERVKKEKAWLEIDGGMRGEIKNRLVRTLGSSQGFVFVFLFCFCFCFCFVFFCFVFGLFFFVCLFLILVLFCFVLFCFCFVLFVALFYDSSKGHSFLFSSFFFFYLFSFFFSFFFFLLFLLFSSFLFFIPTNPHLPNHHHHQKKKKKKNRPAAEAAAPVIARIAQIELPRGEWNELVKGLLQNMSANEPSLKVYSLKTLGYICEVGFFFVFFLVLVLWGWWWWWCFLFFVFVFVFVFFLDSFLIYYK